MSDKMMGKNAGKMSGKLDSDDKRHMKKYGMEKNRLDKMDMVDENKMAKGKPVKNGSILSGYGDNMTSYDALMKKCMNQ